MFRNHVFKIWCDSIYIEYTLKHVHVNDEGNHSGRTPDHTRGHLRNVPLHYADDFNDAIMKLETQHDIGVKQATFRQSSRGDNKLVAASVWSEYPTFRPHGLGQKSTSQSLK